MKVTEMAIALKLENFDILMSFSRHKLSINVPPTPAVLNTELLP